MKGVILASLFCLSRCDSSWPPSTARFSAWRFSCTGLFDARAWALAVRNVADEHAAFGWVQVAGGAAAAVSSGGAVSATGEGGVVGEVRCAAGTAARLEEFLRAGPPDAVGYASELTPYADARIKLHFATFKVLAESRDTSGVFRRDREVPVAAMRKEG